MPSKASQVIVPPLCGALYPASSTLSIVGEPWLANENIKV